MFAFAFFEGLTAFQIKDRKYHLRTYKDCFVGSDAVSLMLTLFDLANRDEVCSSPAIGWGCGNCTRRSRLRPMALPKARRSYSRFCDEITGAPPIKDSAHSIVTTFLRTGPGQSEGPKVLHAAKAGQPLCSIQFLCQQKRRGAPLVQGHILVPLLEAPGNRMATHIHPTTHTRGLSHTRPLLLP